MQCIFNFWNFKNIRLKFLKLKAKNLILPIVKEEAFYLKNQQISIENTSMCQYRKNNSPK